MWSGALVRIKPSREGHVVMLGGDSGVLGSGRSREVRCRGQIAVGGREKEKQENRW